MPRPIEAVVHRDAIAHNLAVMRRAAGDARIWAVVKADAYGHGIERVLAALRGADGLAMLDLSEAERVRAAGWRGPVLLLEGAFEPRDLDACSRLTLTHVVHQEAQIDWLAAHRTQRPHTVMLKLNAGMNRLGFAPTAFRSAWTRLAALTQVGEIGLMTHFASADGEAGIDDAAARFVACTEGLPGERSVANSAALLRHGIALPAAGITQDWVRPGIALYGCAPDHPLHRAADWALQPAMTLRSRVIGLQRLAPGDAVGYGGLYRADRPSVAATVACGYADGYPRHAPTGTPVRIGGLASHTLGRVSMDMLSVAWPEALGEPRLGVEVTLWGRPLESAGEPLDIGDVAHAAGTIGYELMCGLARRVPVRVDAAPDALEPAPPSASPR